ncbi:MAG: hypothetical protein ACODAF_05295 [Actinomycetota bacterium]
MDDNDGRQPDAGTSSEPAPATAQPEAAAPEATGDPRVDEALQRLTALDDMPVGDHVAVVEGIHRTLQDALAEDED